MPKIPSTHSEQGLWRLPPIAWEVPHGGSFFPAQGEVRTRHRRDVGPYEPVSHRPGPLFVRDPEVRLRLLVAADIDAVDELVDELFDDVGAAARQGPSELFARNAQLGGAR